MHTLSFVHHMYQYQHGINLQPKHTVVIMRRHLTLSYHPPSRIADVYHLCRIGLILQYLVKFCDVCQCQNLSSLEEQRPLQGLFCKPADFLNLTLLHQYVRLHWQRSHVFKFIKQWLTLNAAYSRLNEESYFHSEY